MGEYTVSDRIVALAKKHAKDVAKLHQTGIHTGFLSSLGLTFLKQLYKAIPATASGFGFVWEESDGRVLGFIACAESTGKLYKQALWRRGILMALPLIHFLIRPSVVRRMIHTLRYPSQVGDDLPAAEILSIVVSSDARGKGVGKALTSRTFEEFTKRGIGRIKVAVWAGNETANEFYKKCGFDLAVTRQHHGLEMNVYVAKMPLR